MRRQLHLHETGFPRDKFLTSYSIGIQVFFRIFFLYMVLTIFFWIDWVHVYKYTKIKGLDLREITSLPESKKSDEHGTSFFSVIAENENNWSKFCSLRFFFFSTICSKVTSTLSSNRIRGPTYSGKALNLLH